MEKIKEIIFTQLTKLCKETSYGCTMEIKNKDRGGHRDPCVAITAHLNNPTLIIIRVNYQTSEINVGLRTKVSKFPELALKQYQKNDEVHYGCPHHYELSKDKTKILYVRHGTNGFGETSDRYVEKEIEDLFLEASFSKEEISSLPYNSVDAYHESTAKGILLAAEACRVLRY